VSPSRSDPAWRALDGLEKLLDHRVRLAICVLLSRNGSISFQRLKQLLDETDGSLGAHLRKLEDAGFIRAEKTYRDRRPITWYSMAPAGRKRLRSHLGALERVIRGVGAPDGDGGR